MHRHSFASLFSLICLLHVGLTLKLLLPLMKSSFFIFYSSLLHHQIMPVMAGAAPGTTGLKLRPGGRRHGIPSEVGNGRQVTEELAVKNRPVSQKSSSLPPACLPLTGLLPGLRGRFLSLCLQSMPAAGLHWGSHPANGGSIWPGSVLGLPS